MNILVEIFTFTLRTLIKKTNMYSEIDKLRSKIIDKIILIILLFFSVLCFSDILRWNVTGWHEITIIHTVLFAILIVLFVYRKKISLGYKVFILKDLLAIVGLVALWYFGFSGIHYFVIISIALVSIFTPRKRAFIFIGLLSVFYIAIGILYATGIKDAAVELNLFSHSLPHWITIILSLIAFSVVYVAGFGEMHKELVNNIKKKISIKIELEKHVDELEDTKAKLDKTVTELNALNLKLQTSEERFSQLIRNSFDMIVLLDANGVQQYVSESCERILGYKPDELLNFPVIEKLIHPDDREKTMAGLKDILVNNKHGGTQYRHRHKNGDWVYLEAFGSNQIDNPQIHSVVLNVRDITERKEAELALQQNEARLSELNATKDKLFSIIAHDLKSPFNSILGFSQLLKENYNDYTQEEQKSFIDIMHLGISNAYELLEDLLLWSRTQQDTIYFSPKNESLFILTNKIKDTLKISADKKQVDIDVQIPHDLSVKADGFMISTVIRNLISNAIKYTSSGTGKIQVSAKEVKNDSGGRQVEICILDNGIGISKKKLHKLFDVGENVSTPGTADERGTGLGLPICFDFVRRHGGNLWVESEKGKGSAFYFSIPG